MPSEQFQILSLINFKIFNCDFSFLIKVLYTILVVSFICNNILPTFWHSGEVRDASIIDDLIRKIREVAIAIIKEMRKKGGKILKYLLKKLIKLLKKFIFWGLSLLKMMLFWFCFALISRLLYDLGLHQLDSEVFLFIFFIWVKMFFWG